MTDWLFPIQGAYRLSQKFGANQLNYGQFGLLGHDGLDYAASRGTPVFAPDDGLVVESYGAAKPDAGGYGNQVRLLTKTGIQDFFYDHIFGHFLKVFVEVGQQITKGTLVGLIDSTGFSTGDHLHWGVRKLNRTPDGTGTFKQYLTVTYNIIDYNNGYFGYFDQTPLIKGEKDEMLAVDLRYGQEKSSIREWAWKVKNEAYAQLRARKAQIPYNDRIKNAFVYGYWDADFVFEIANFPVWANMHKPEFEKIKKIGRSGRWLTDIN